MVVKSILTAHYIFITRIFRDFSQAVGARVLAGLVMGRWSGPGRADLKIEPGRAGPGRENLKM